MNIDSILVAPPTANDFKQHRDKCPFVLMLHGQPIPFEHANEASEILTELRDECGMGASQFGSMHPIMDKAGNEVGYVSYNGKVWEGTRANWQTARLIYSPGQENADDHSAQFEARRKSVIDDCKQKGLKTRGINKALAAPKLRWRIKQATGSLYVGGAGLNTELVDKSQATVWDGRDSFEFRQRLFTAILKQSLVLELCEY